MAESYMQKHIQGQFEIIKDKASRLTKRNHIRFNKARIGTGNKECSLSIGGVN